MDLSLRCRESNLEHDNIRCQKSEMVHWLIIGSLGRLPTPTPTPTWCHVVSRGFAISLDTRIA